MRLAECGMQDAVQDVTHKETVLIAMGNWLQKLYMGCIKTDDRQQVVGLMYAVPCIIVRSSQAISSRCSLYMYRIFSDQSVCTF